MCHTRHEMSNTSALKLGLVVDAHHTGCKHKWPRCSYSGVIVQTTLLLFIRPERYWLDLSISLTACRKCKVQLLGPSSSYGQMSRCRALLYCPALQSPYGGAINGQEEGGYVKVRSCRFISNLASDKGAAIHVENERHLLDIQDTVFDSNKVRLQLLATAQSLAGDARCKPAQLILHVLTNDEGLE